MAVPEYRDEVSITLSIADPPPNFAFPARRIFLSKKNPTIEIGRTSKRNVAFEASKSNAWFDSPVMSRKHALFTLDADKQKLYVKDTGSLHGTYKNDVRLETNVDSEVVNGDKLKFGAFIERPQDRHYPCSMTVRQTYGCINPELRGNSFRVPEDSDVESLSSDGDQVDNSYEMLRSKNFIPSRMAPLSCGRDPIDLTLDDQYHLSNVGDDHSASTSSSNAPHIVEIPSPQVLQVPQVSDPVSISAREFSDLEDVDDEGNQMSPNSMDTDDDSYGGISDDGQSIDYAVSSVAGDSIADEEEDFAEHDEFEEEQVQADGDALQENPSLEETTIMTSVMDENPDARISYAQPLADSLTTQTRNVAHESDHANPHQLDKNHYTWKSDLPPMMSINGTSSMRLPSLSEAVFDNYTHEMNTTISTADIVGRKHGKYEFFAAREANASTVRAQASSPSIDPLRQVSSQEQCLFQTEAEKSTSAAQAEDVQQPSRDEFQPAASDLINSGIKYLATPPTPIEPAMTSAEPEVDETSAFSFHKSKQASDAEAAKTADQAVAQEDDTDIADVGNAAEPAELLETVEGKKAAEPVKAPVPESTATTATKRKADAISQLTPEEEQMPDERIIRRQSSRKCRAQAGRPRRAPATAARPHKRLRRMAEAVGYVALGGAAVMSVLIATAPAL
ncbi:sarcolemmal membrane-associated [Fusarium beomiforme]|uniref:Sarcolemmal membrane-associated n=1 Tax=Fusarium beomiforme TaxID=44412 RepID=A0A9P5ABQ9_9HYPO|nr:sarcolemmal membrane-associated [Fusarium beomiforme]